MIEACLAGHRTAIVWPESPADISDRDPWFLVAYLPLELGGKPRGQQETVAKDLLEKCGEKPRTFRNGLGMAIPAGDQVEILRRAVRYLIATEGVRTKAKQLNLTDEQKDQLRERQATESAAAESALLKLYTEVWLPRAEEGGIGIEKVAAAVADDEIDLESGFLMLPQSIPEAAPMMRSEPAVAASGGGTGPAGGGTTGGTTIPTGATVPGVTVPPAKPATDKTVDITFTADRNGLFTAWNAIANLADLAGKVQVTIHAESEKGFEKSKLQNGVMEPLREADLIE